MIPKKQRGKDRLILIEKHPLTASVDCKTKFISSARPFIPKTKPINKQTRKLYKSKQRQAPPPLPSQAKSNVIHSVYSFTFMEIFVYGVEVINQRGRRKQWNDDIDLCVFPYVYNKNGEHISFARI